MKNGTAHRDHARPGAQGPGFTAVPTVKEAKLPAPRVSPASQPVSALESDIVVREEELGTIKAQRLYKMRCECGRSWFELELPTLVECPACKKLGLVSA
jgi:hypothetical protein